MENLFLILYFQVSVCEDDSDEDSSGVLSEPEVGASWSKSPTRQFVKNFP